MKFARSTALAAGLFVTALAAVGCSADTSAPDTTTTSARSTDAVFSASDATLASTGISYYVVHADGSGAAYSAKGDVVLSFRATFDGTHGGLAMQTGTQQVQFDYAITKHDDGSTELDGNANGSPISALVSKDGDVLRSAGAPVDATLRPTFDALNRDFQGYASAHEPGRCALAIMMLAASIGTEMWGWALTWGVKASAEC
jgi:hypothetical protein